MRIANFEIEFMKIDPALMLKTTYSEKGLMNVLKTISSDYITEKNDFLVYIKENQNILHIKTKKNDSNIAVELKDILTNSNIYINSGILSRKITGEDERENVSNLLN